MSRAEYEENLWREFEEGKIDEFDLEICLDNSNPFGTYIESEVY